MISNKYETEQLTHINNDEQKVCMSRTVKVKKRRATDDHFSERKLLTN